MMTRVAVSVEGPTEEAFVKEVLAPSLAVRSIQLDPINMRGNVSLPRVATEIYKLSFNYDVITTFYDFYGFKNRPTPNVKTLEEAIGGEVNKIFTRNGRCFNADTVHPYIQLHEFEALLFSNVQVFELIPGVTKAHIAALAQIRNAFVTPEDINDSPQTAPSKRLGAMKFRYDKVEYGPVLALEIGLETIRAACPRFGEWATWLETL